MPTFANVQLQNLLDPGAPQKPLSNGDQDSDPVNGGPTPRHVYISPVLYVTPEQAPMPEYSSPDPVFSSPYVVNNKRRGGGNEPRRVGPGNVPDLPPENEGGGLGAEMMVGGNSVNENDDFDDDEGFLDTRSEAISVGSEVEANNDFSVRGKSESGDVVSTQGDFFDAIDGTFGFFYLCLIIVSCMYYGPNNEILVGVEIGTKYSISVLKSNFLILISKIPIIRIRI